MQTIRRLVHSENNRQCRTLQINPSIILALGYLCGQGSTFFSQLVLKNYGSLELVGVAVLYISLFSLGLQFGEFGNFTYIAKHFSQGKLQKVYRFLIIRSIVGALLVFIVVAYEVSSNASAAPLSFLLFVPCVAAISGLGRNGLLEIKGWYGINAVVQAIPWLAIAASLPFLLLERSVDRFLMPVWIISVIGSFILARRALRHEMSSVEVMGRFTASETIESIAHIAPPIGGQILGRIIIISTHNIYGLAALGMMGLVKYIQVALALILGFWMRPIHRIIILNFTQMNEREIYLAYLWPLIFSTSVPALAFLAVQLDYIPRTTREWATLSIITPFWVINSVNSIINSLALKARSFVALEYIGLIANGMVFLIVSPMGLPIALALGEISQYVLCIFLSRTVRKHYSVRGGQI